MPGNDLFPQHKGEAQQEGDRADLTQATTDTADQHIYHSGQRCASLMQGGEDRRACLRVGVGHREDIRHRPCGHLCRERDQQEDTSHQSGVEDVVTQTTKRHLSNADRGQRTDQDDPDRQVRGNVEGQQHACQDGGTVAKRGLLLHQEALDQVLKNHAGQD